MYCFAWFSFSMHRYLHVHELQWSFNKVMRLLLHHAWWDNLTLNQFGVSAVWSQQLLHNKMILESNDIKITRNYWREISFAFEDSPHKPQFQASYRPIPRTRIWSYKLKICCFEQGWQEMASSIPTKKYIESSAVGFKKKKVYTLRSRCSNHPVVRSFILCKYGGAYITGISTTQLVD